MGASHWFWRDWLANKMDAQLVRGYFRCYPFLPRKILKASLGVMKIFELGCSMERHSNLIVRGTTALLSAGTCKFGSWLSGLPYAPKSGGQPNVEYGIYAKRLDHEERTVLSSNATYVCIHLQASLYTGPLAL